MYGAARITKFTRSKTEISIAYICATHAKYKNGKKQYLMQKQKYE